MTPDLIVILLALGLGTGFLAGLFGIGGGIVLVPLLTFILSRRGFPDSHVVHTAIATSMSIIFFTSIASVYAHQMKRAILWRAALLLIPGVVVGSWIGPMIAAGLPTRHLAGIFGVFVVFSALRMLWPGRKGGEAKRLPGVAGMATAGLGIGTLSGLVGSGGGFITVPFLGWVGLSIHNAVATSAVMGFPIALSGTLSNIWQGWGVQGLPPGSLGFIYLPAVVCVAAGSMLSAPLGARTAYRMDVTQLRIAFALMLLFFACYMFWKAITIPA